MNNHPVADDLYILDPSSSIVTNRRRTGTVGDAAWAERYGGVGAGAGGGGNGSS